MPGLYSRFNEFFDFEPLASSPSNVIDPNTARNPSFRSQKHKARIEQLGLDYVHGKPLFILSAELRGPFDSSWVNPWLDRRGKSRENAQNSAWGDGKANRNQCEQHPVEIHGPPRKKPRRQVEEKRRKVNKFVEARPASQLRPTSGTEQAKPNLSPSENPTPSGGLVASSHQALNAKPAYELQSRYRDSSNKSTGFAISSSIQDTEQEEAQPKHIREWILSTDSGDAVLPDYASNMEPSEHLRSTPEYHSLPIRASEPRRQTEQGQQARVSKAILYDDLLELERVVSSEALNLRGTSALSVVKWQTSSNGHSDRGDVALRLAMSPPVRRALDFAERSSKGTRRLIDFEALSPAINTRPKLVASSSAPEPREFKVKGSPGFKDDEVAVRLGDKIESDPQTCENGGDTEHQQLGSPYPSTQAAIQQAHKEFQEGLRSVAKAPELGRIACVGALGPESSSESEQRCEITPFQQINWMNKFTGVVHGEGSMCDTQELFDGVSPFDASPAKRRDGRRNSFVPSPTSARSLLASQIEVHQASANGSKIEAGGGDCPPVLGAEQGRVGLDLNEFVDEANSVLGNWSIEKAAKGVCLSP